MSSREVSRKVKLLGTWNEDVFTDDIIKTIAALAKSENGKTVKVILSLRGVKLTRSKLFQERKTTIFPIRDLRTVTRSPEFSQCVLLILSNVDKKYKIIALRCASEKDAVHLVSGFVEIQKYLSSSQVDLKKKDNGNWTLRERLFPRSRRLITDVYSDRTPNGDLGVATENGTVKRYAAGPDSTDIYTTVSHQKGVYMKRTIGNSNSYRVTRKKDYIIDGNDVSDYVIETEVLQSTPHTSTEVHARHHSDDIRKHKERSQYASAKIPEVNQIRLDSGRPRVYSGQSMTPPAVVYSTTTRRFVPPQPVVYREHSSKTYEARMETPVAYYPKSMQGRGTGSLQSDTLPVRVWGGNFNMTFDQRSVRSNTSKTSQQSRKKKSSDFFYPTTVVRSIERTYPRAPVVFRRGADQFIAYRPGSDNYYVMESGEPHIYPKDSHEMGKRH